MPTEHCYVAAPDAAETVPLRSTREPLDATDPCFVSGDPLTVSILGFHFNRSHESWIKGSNEVVLSSEHRLADAGRVRALHIAQTGVKAPKPFQDLDAPVVFRSEDYNGDDRLTLAFHAVEVDKVGKDKIRALAKKIEEKGTLYPAIAKYLGLAADVGKIVVDVSNALDDNDDIFDQDEHRVALYPKARSGRRYLQPGRYVVFQDAQPLDGLHLNRDGVVVRRVAAGAETEFTDCTYLVFVLSRRRGGRLPGFDPHSAKVADLVAKADDQSRGGDDGTIGEVVKGYEIYTKLRRYHELRQKRSRTRAEDTRLVELSRDDNLRRFLPAT